MGNTYRHDWKGLEAGEVREWTDVPLQTRILGYGYEWRMDE
jgi:hypothetical protein